MYNQTVTCNTWGKVCSVWQTDNTDFYNHSIEYGPDLKRVTSETHKTYNTLFEKFYWDDYEERKVGNDLYQYYYVYGGDGLAGLHIVKTSPNSTTTTHTTKVITDHLGSIIELRESRYWRASYSANYDEWGKRSVYRSYSFDPYFDRGYTGHEHLLNEFGLINMNGRMYDPNLGRFLSPDNYIQSPGNPQNYNRYSYCLNNPLKYTDPEGELFWEAVLIGAAVFGTGNLVSHSIRGDVNSIGDGLRYFGQGALAGAALGATWYLAPCIPVYGNAIQSYMSLSFGLKIGMTTLSASNGVLQGVATNDWSALHNSAKIFWGNFYIDENAGFLEGVWHGYSKNTFESLQTGLGHTCNQFLNSIWRVKSVSYGYGATVVESYSSKGGGFTLGSFVHGHIGIEPKANDELFQHEYGHYLQSRATGLAYLFVYAIESLGSATVDKLGRIDCHRSFYAEIDANRRAFSYFMKIDDTFSQTNNDGYTTSSNWYWQVNPLEKKRNSYGQYNTRYKF